MTSTEVRITPAIEAFVDDARRAADTAFRGVPGDRHRLRQRHRQLRRARARRGNWRSRSTSPDRGRGPQCEADPRDVDGEVLSGDGPAGFVTGYAKVVSEHTRDHVDRARAHPVVGGWAQDTARCASSTRPRSA